MRVVTLLPTATEILAALGVEPVGVSHQCDYPPEVADLPTVTRSRIETGGTSAEINDAVDEAQSAAEGVYEIDRDLLADLDPDLIVAQGICEVCAVDEVLVREAVADLGLDADVITTDPHSLADLIADVRRIGEAVGCPARAEEVIADFETRIDRVRSRAVGADDRPTVAVLDWLDPVMVAGHWIPEMVEVAGGTYGLAEPGARSRPRPFEEIREYDPDVIVAAPCGFDVSQTVSNLTELTDRQGWHDLAAVHEDRAYVMDGSQYVNRPGPRLVETLEYLAGLVHPDWFDQPPESVARPLLDSTVRS